MSSELITLKGQVLQTFGPNINGVVYTKESVEKALEKMRKPLYGSISQDFVDGVSINLEKVSHVVENAHIEGDKVIGDIVVLATPNGKILADVINGGHMAHYRFGPKAVGTINQNKELENLKIISYDLVPKGPGRSTEDENRERDQDGNQET